MQIIMNNDIDTKYKTFKDVFEYFKWLIFDHIGNHCFIAGGALRDYFSIGNNRSDIDIFFPDDFMFKEVKDKLKDNPVITENENGIMYNFNHHKIHLICKKYYTSAEECIKTFDFTVCCAAISPYELIFHDRFFIDLAKRRLVINRLDYPISTMQRLQKYFNKGYWICNGGILEIAKAINGLDLSSHEQNNIEFYPDGTPKFIRID